MRYLCACYPDYLCYGILYPNPTRNKHHKVAFKVTFYKKGCHIRGILFCCLIKMFINKFFYLCLVNFGLLIHSVAVVAAVENYYLGIAGVILLDLIK